MSNKEKVIALLDSVPEYKMGYLLAYLQGLTADEDDGGERLGCCGHRSFGPPFQRISGTSLAAGPVGVRVYRRGRRHCHYP